MVRSTTIGLLMLCLFELTSGRVWATTVSIRLVGLVQDQRTQRPLAARLSVQTATGRLPLGISSAQTGAFSITVTYPATELLIQCPGYLDQHLNLNASLTAPGQPPVPIIIPLLAVDELAVDKPYSQTEQTHFEQKDTGRKGKQSQHNQFTVSDALTGLPIIASICFFFTKDGRRRCLITDQSGQFFFDFKARDIVALEISAPTYQSYYGNLIVDELDGRTLKHSIQLARTLAVVSLQFDPATDRCELRRSDTKAVVPFLTVPGYPGSAVAYNLSPCAYSLTVFDRFQNIREQRQITVTTGLTVIRVGKTDVPRQTTGPLIDPDSLPLLYFEQGSFVLRPEAKAALLEVVAYLLTYPDVMLKISGHTDREGDERLNRSLSWNRAKVVFNFLTANRVPDDRMQFNGFGSQFTVSSSDDEAEKAKNRRVQLEFSHRR